MPRKNKRLMKADDLYRLQSITDARVSPDGRYAILSKQWIESKSEKKYSNLWLAPTGPGKMRQFTYGKQTDGMPRWSPDGTQIAFVSNRADEQQAQVYLIMVDGGEARPLTTLKGTIGSLEWSPNGRQLLLSFRKKDKEAIERDQDEEKKKLGIVARHITETHFKLDGAGYLPHEKWHIWTVNAASGKAAQLTEDNRYHELSPSWSPDGKEIAFVSNRSDNPDLKPDEVELFAIPAGGGEKRTISTPIGSKMAPTFSPDGRWLAYIGIEGEMVGWRNMSLWVVPSDSSAPARNLSVAADLHVYSITSTDTGGGSMMPPTWSNDGQTVYVQVTRHGDTELVAVPISGRAAEIKRVLPRPGIVGPFTFDRDQAKLVYSLNTFVSPGQLFVHDMATGKERKLTRINEPWLNRVDLGQIEEVWFKAADGHDLHGWILTPPDFDPKQKYPSILEIHGGPQVQYGRGFMHEFYLLAAHGYVVYFSNPRGGQGYGEAHCKAIWNQWGTVDFDDVMAWTDFVEQKPYIDKNRMGVTGGSYGGYMTSMIIGRTPRFKAAVTQRSVNNIISMWGSSDFNWHFQKSITADRMPFEDLQKYWDASPMKFIGGAKTPTLVIHSEKDYRVAQEQGEQVFVALKKLGIDTELVLFPDEPHGLSRVGRTDRRIVRLKHMLRWFEKYL